MMGGREEVSHRILTSFPCALTCDGMEADSLIRIQARTPRPD